jgi:uncharacterized protein (TIGR03086 family)
VESLNPIGLYERAARRAVDVAIGVRAEQLSDATPCTAWTVQDLMDHLVGGTRYLAAAIDGVEPVGVAGATADDFRAGVEACLDGLGGPGVLERTCTSPLGFDWTVSEATAGTFMDVLVHTWDLATATGQSTDLDEELVGACVAMFLPDMPARGRAAGLIGPEVPVPSDAGPQERLLGAMGRQS